MKAKTFPLLWTNIFPKWENFPKYGNTVPQTSFLSRRYCAKDAPLFLSCFTFDFTLFLLNLLKLDQQHVEITEGRENLRPRVGILKTSYANS
jgi:hypothetical protein